MGVFFRGFLENPGMVASVIPSSRVTIRAMLEKVDWQACQLFVEYGPGVGTFCPHILDRLPPAPAVATPAVLLNDTAVRTAVEDALGSAIPDAATGQVALLWPNTSGCGRQT